MDLALRAAAAGGRRPWADALLLAAPALLLALLALPFRYDVTLAEPDLVRMMAGMVYGSASGAYEAAGMHYGLKFSFGYYKLLYAISPENWLRHPDLAARVMNGFGVLSGVLCALACSLYLRAIFGATIAAATGALFFLSPVALPLAFSGHPLVPAAACLFAGGWLLARGEERGGRTAALLWAFALALLVAGLSLRAEIVLAFPFLWLAAAPRRAAAQRPWAPYAARAAVLAAAFALFLLLQQPYVTEDGGAAASVWAFLQWSAVLRMAQGVVVLALATGGATLLLALPAAWRARLRQREVYLPLVLAAPALLLWLPIPQPARHFFFAVLACCLFVALWLQRRGSPAQVLGLALLVALANQVIAEMVRPAIVSRYAWSYPAVTERRATQRVPLGAFALDQRANQALAGVERREAMQLAARAPQHLVILADSQHYMVAHLLAADPALTWTRAQWRDLEIAELRSAARHIVLIERQKAWPRDVAREVLEEQQWRQWPIYVQPSTVSRFDRTALPLERRYTLP